MYVSNTVAAQSPFQFRSYPPSPGVSTPSAADASGAPQASSGRGGSYDFTSLTPKGFMKNVNDLFNAGKISQQDMNAAWSLALLPPGIQLSVDPASQLNSSYSTAHINFLEKLRQQIDIDQQNGYAAPGQVQREQTLLDTLTALQGTPKGVDKLA